MAKKIDAVTEPGIEVIEVDKNYLIKRINDLMNANPKVFEEYFYLKSVLDQRKEQTPKE